MTEKYIIYQDCVKCAGTGEIQVIIRYEGNPPQPIYETQTCDNCKGIQKAKWGEMIK